MSNETSCARCSRSGQSRRLSMLESLANLFVGFGASFLITYFVLPFWGLEPRPVEALEIVLVYTIISVVRSYGLRRLFEGRF